MIIYKITNKKNGKVYIGMTTTSLKSRWYLHKRSANNNSTTLMGRAIQKYGEDAFSLEIIDSAADRNELAEREKMWIELYSSRDNSCGYNLAEGGFGGSGLFGEKNHWFGKKNPFIKNLNKKRKGVKLSEAHRKNISKSQIGKTMSEDSKIKQSETVKNKWADENSVYKSDSYKEKFSKRPQDNIQIICIENGVIYKNQRQAAEELKIQANSICRMLNGKAKTAGGFTFRYLNSDYRKKTGEKNYSEEMKRKSAERMRNTLLTHPSFTENKQLILDKLKKKVICNETNEVFASQMDAADAMGISRSYLHAHLKNKYKLVKGYTFSYYNN